MTNSLLIAILFSAVSFFIYGVLLLYSKEMHAEFIRYRLLKFKVLTAILELFGALGLVIGIYVPVILIISSGGLTLLMLFAFIIRVKLKDAYYLIMPSLFYLLLNLYILVSALRTEFNY